MKFAQIFFWICILAGILVYIPPIYSSYNIFTEMTHQQQMDLQETAELFPPIFVKKTAGWSIKSIRVTYLGKLLNTLTK